MNYKTKSPASYFNGLRTSTINLYRRVSGEMVETLPEYNAVENFPSGMIIEGCQSGERGHTASAYVLPADMLAWQEQCLTDGEKLEAIKVLIRSLQSPSEIEIESDDDEVFRVSCAALCEILKSRRAVKRQKMSLLYLNHRAKNKLGARGHSC